MATKVTTWAAWIAAVLVLTASGTASASSVLLSPNSCLGKITLEGGLHRASAAVSAEACRSYSQACSCDAAGLFVAPSNGPVPRLGPHGVDPAHHNANIMVRDASGRLRHHERIVSGNMTPEEQALGFPRNTLASHTAARAIRNIPLQRGETTTITGQRPPCPTCKGVMNQAARDSGATIIYRWRENGVTRTWTAGN